jgi:hypothetical protein
LLRVFPQRVSKERFLQAAAGFKSAHPSKMFSKAIPHSKDHPHEGFARDSTTMPHRTFTDLEGNVWEVWQVTPISVKNAAGEMRGAVEPGYEHGWLCFENKSGDKRRLITIPADWDKFTEAQLEELRLTAKKVK